MGFYYDYYFPNKEQPEFVVYKIQEGYKFIFFDTNGNEEHNFFINEDIIEKTYAATGYVGKEANAIEIFRKFMRFK